MAKPKKLRIGRPPVAAADRRETHVHVLVTEAEHSEIKLAAAREGTNVSLWVRALILRRARQIAMKLRQASKQEKHDGDSDIEAEDGGGDAVTIPGPRKHPDEGSCTRPPLSVSRGATALETPARRSIVGICAS